MKGDMTSFFGQTDFVTLDGNSTNTDEEKVLAWQLISQMCKNDSGQIARMIGLIQ
jgi:hypothetical protein